MIVILSSFQSAVTPAGKLTGVPIPVAPVVVWIMLVITVPTHTVGEREAGVTVSTAFTVIVPVALTVPQPPVKGMA